MNLLQLARAAEILAQERPPVTVEPMLCLRARNKASSCAVCVNGCPTSALQLIDNQPAVVSDACIRCGLCLHLCPTGVFDGRDDVNRLLYCAEQLVDRSIVEIACAPHPDVTKGDGRVDAVIRTNGCLAALGTSAYLGLAALGVQHVRVRLDACDACPLAMLRPQIERTMQAAHDLLTAAQRPAALVVAPLARQAKARPVYSTRNPPVSRRGFFQALARQSRSAAEEIAPPDEAQLSEDERVPRERRRLIRALRRISPPAQAAVPGAGFARMSVSNACTACSVCARVCPTGALVMRQNEEQFELSLNSASCMNCGLCITLCEAGALQPDEAPTFAALLVNQEEVLYRGKLQRCRKCRSLFAGQPADGLCPMCAYRKRNPFGTRPPVDTFKPAASR